jgi:hypothetical protein
MQIGCREKYNSVSMRFRPCSVPISKSNLGYLGKGLNTGTLLPIHLKEVFVHFELTDCRLLDITTDIVSTKYLMRRELQSILKSFGIKWPAKRNSIQCMAHVIQVALGVFMSGPSVKATPSIGEAQEHQQPLKFPSETPGYSERLSRL